MPTYTLFAYGTGENRRETNNIISQFSKAWEGGPQDGRTILDGPGLLGREVEVNVQEGTREILEWIEQQEGPHNINMTGFSRGSATCIRIANALKERELELEKSRQNPELLAKLKNMNLNMFLMDPVAGMTDKSNPNNKIIPDNVKNYVAVLQMDERRRDFKPQDLSRVIVADPKKTQVSMLPMYGNHSDTTKIKTNKMESGPKLMWYALHQFLTDHGTRFENNRIPQMVYGEKYGASAEERLPTDLDAAPTPKKLLALFSKNHEERDAYYKSGIKAKPFDSMPMPRAERQLNKQLPFYVKRSDFFVNQLERELFKVSYPTVFNYLFEANMPDPRFPGASHREPVDVVAELATLKREDPELFARLKDKRGVSEQEDVIRVGGPRGYNYLEPCMTMQQVFPSMLPQAVMQQAQEMNKLPLLEQEVYRMTFRYQRDKTELNFAGEKSEYDRVVRLREEIFEIITTHPGTREEKHKLVLDKVEGHFKELVLSGSVSGLVPMMGQLLAKNGRPFKIDNPSVANEILVELVHGSLSLIKEAVSFAGNLGYVGGSALYAVGAAIESIGERANELIGKVGYNPIKGLCCLVASLVEGAGFMIKHSFGLKPLTEFVSDGLKDMRDWLVRKINSTTITPILGQEIRRDIDQVMPLERPLELDLTSPSTPLLNSGNRDGEVRERSTSDYRAAMASGRAQVRETFSAPDDELSDAPYQQLRDSTM